MKIKFISNETCTAPWNMERWSLTSTTVSIFRTQHDLRFELQFLSAGLYNIDTKTAFLFPGLLLDHLRKSTSHSDHDGQSSCLHRTHRKAKYEKKGPRDWQKKKKTTNRKQGGKGVSRNIWETFQDRNGSLCDVSKVRPHYFTLLPYASSSLTPIWCTLTKKGNTKGETALMTPTRGVHHVVSIVPKY